jgi:hypothetical protein
MAIQISRHYLFCDRAFELACFSLAGGALDYRSDFRRKGRQLRSLAAKLSLSPNYPNHPNSVGVSSIQVTIPETGDSSILGCRRLGVCQYCHNSGRRRSGSSAYRVFGTVVWRSETGRPPPRMPLAKQRRIANDLLGVTQPYTSGANILTRRAFWIPGPVFPRAGSARD